MSMVVTDPAPPAPAGSRMTLLDWISAHRSVLEEQERLDALAARHRKQLAAAEALERQRQRVQGAQDAADAIYDEVMQDLRAA